MSENFLSGKVTKYGMKIIHPEPSIVLPGIKAIWDEADKKKISIKEIVETVKEVRKQVYNEEYLLFLKATF